MGFAAQTAEAIHRCKVWDRVATVAISPRGEAYCSRQAGLLSSESAGRVSLHDDPEGDERENKWGQASSGSSLAHVGRQWRRRVPDRLEKRERATA